MLRLKEKPLVPLHRQLFLNPSALPSGDTNCWTSPQSQKQTNSPRCLESNPRTPSSSSSLAPSRQAFGACSKRPKQSHGRIPRVKFTHRSGMGEVLVSPSTTLWPLRYRERLFYTKARTYEYACFNSCLPIYPHICVKLPRGWDGQSCFAVSWELKGLHAPHHYHSEWSQVSS